MKRARHLQGRRPVAERVAGGPGQVAFQNGTAAFMINYPFVWSATQAGNPKVFKDMGYAYFPQVTPGDPPKGLDRRLQPRHLGLLQAPEPGLPGGSVPDPGQEPEPGRDQGRPRAGRREHLRPAGVREGLSVPPADQAAAPDVRNPARRRRPTRTSRSRSRRPCRPPRTSTRTRWSAHCVTRSSCPCPHRPCCERRHRPRAPRPRQRPAGGSI